MRPRSSSHDGLDVGLADAVLASEVVLIDVASRIPSADIENLLLRQSGLPGAFPVSSVVSATDLAVVGIEGMCPEQQVVGIDALTNVARVANDGTGWYRAVHQFVDKTVCANDSSVDPKLAVRLATPEPASFGDRHVAAEYLERIKTPPTHCHIIRSGGVG